jgi:hypothetical protein
VSSNQLDEVLRAYDLVLPIDPEAERPKQLAAGVPTLDRKVLGLLDNRKGNADRLLMKLGERLGERYALLDIVYLTKPIFSRPATPAQIAQLKECDVVLTALAD